MSSVGNNALRRAALALCMSVWAISFAAGCRQDMGDQPKAKPLEPSDFFADGRSERPLIENTVARGSSDEDNLVVPGDSNAFPLPVNIDLLKRGQERYSIFCSPCHGLQGDGNGMVAVRGMKHPPSYHEERLRQMPNGHYYDVISNGFGAMYSYSAQVPPRDRWAIIAYIRALQLSRNAKIADLPPDVRQKLTAAEAGTSQGSQGSRASAPASPGGTE